MIVATPRRHERPGFGRGQDPSSTSERAGRGHAPPSRHSVMQPMPAIAGPVAACPCPDPNSSCAPWTQCLQWEWDERLPNVMNRHKPTHGGHDKPVPPGWRLRFRLTPRSRSPRSLRPCRPLNRSQPGLQPVPHRRPFAVDDAEVHRVTAAPRRRDDVLPERPLLDRRQPADRRARAARSANRSSTPRTAAAAARTCDQASAASPRC